MTIRIYNPEKTLADGFKFRNKIGMDVVLEALKLNKSRKKFNLAKVLEYAKTCRVEKSLSGGSTVSMRGVVKNSVTSVRKRLLNRSSSTSREKIWPKPFASPLSGEALRFPM